METNGNGKHHMRRSESIANLTEALAKASLAFPPIPRGCTATVRTKNGSSYSYSYADLDDILSAVRKPLAENGLTIDHDCVVNMAEIEDEYGKRWIPRSVTTTATLWHSSGEWKQSSPFEIPCDGTMAPAQIVGSGSTYGKRYTSQNILGLSTEQDDDGNSAAGNDADTGKRDMNGKPACPACNSKEYVYADKEGGGYFCWKNQPKKKFGCGHKWTPGVTPAPESTPDMKLLDDWKLKVDRVRDDVFAGDDAGARLNALIPEFTAIPGQHKKRDAIWKVIAALAAELGYSKPHGQQKFVPREPGVEA